MIKITKKGICKECDKEFSWDQEWRDPKNKKEFSVFKRLQNWYINIGNVCFGCSSLSQYKYNKIENL
jgi:hypothetical protein